MLLSILAWSLCVLSYNRSLNKCVPCILKCHEKELKHSQLYESYEATIKLNTKTHA